VAASLVQIPPLFGRQPGGLAFFSFQRQPRSYWFAAIKRSSVRFWGALVAFIRRAANTISWPFENTDCCWVRGEASVASLAAIRGIQAASIRHNGIRWNQRRAIESRVVVADGIILHASKIANVMRLSDHHNEFPRRRVFCSKNRKANTIVARIELHVWKH